MFAISKQFKTKKNDTRVKELNKLLEILYIQIIIKKNV